MRSSIDVRWLALGIGVVAVITVSLAMWTGQQTDSQDATEPGQPSSDVAAINESANIEIKRAEKTEEGAVDSPASDEARLNESARVLIAPGAALSNETVDSTAGDAANLSESAEVDVDEAAVSLGSPTGDTAALSESADLVVQRLPTAPPAGGPGGTNTLLKDVVTFVVRDASGQIKQQGVIE